LAGGIFDNTTKSTLDGEWTLNSTGASGNGTEGGDFVFQFDVLPGDLDNDGDVDVNDTGILPTTVVTLNASNLLLNVNGDLILNSQDQARVVEREGSRLVP
jgi:hypothetical protein